MEGQIDLFTLLSMIIAVIAALKLRSVLGRRTDDDDARIARRSREADVRDTGGPAASLPDKVVALPRRDREGTQSADATVAESQGRGEEIRVAAKGDERLMAGLTAISDLDRDFHPEPFIAGARQAYEIIVTAFAEGDRKALRDLLSRDVYEGFVSSLNERDARGERVEQDFVGINKADILDAEVRNGVANITMRFVSQLITATRDQSGAVVAGDPARIADVTDIWTFSRDISTARARANPNWRLIATRDAH